MARVLFSAAINSIRGSVGGSTFQKNKAGFTFKNKQSISRSVTINQGYARTFVSELIALWQLMTDVQRNAWTLYINYFPSYCKNNKNVLLTAYQLFLKYNLIRLHAGLTPLINIVYITPYVYSPWLNISDDFGDIYLEFYDDVEPDVWFALVKLSMPKSHDYPINASNYKVVKLDGSSGELQNITESYYNAFGIYPHAGQYLSYIITVFNTTCPAIQAPFKSICEITPL